jgi:hypothetical protein
VASKPERSPSFLRGRTEKTLAVHNVWTAFF